MLEEHRATYCILKLPLALRMFGLELLAHLAKGLMSFTQWCRVYHLNLYFS